MTKIAPPLTERQAARIEPLGLLADAPAGLVEAWQKIEALWSATIERARLMPTEMLDARVGGEWSFLETLRHLVMVTDTWIGKVVLEKPAPYDPIGLPPDFVTNGAELGLDLDARPSPEEVLRSRRRAMADVNHVLSGVTGAELDRCCVPFDGQFTVLGAVQNVIFEEWAHHQYATRDLATLQHRL